LAESLQQDQKTSRSELLKSKVGSDALAALSA